LRCWPGLAGLLATASLCGGARAQPAEAPLSLLLSCSGTAMVTQTTSSQLLLPDETGSSFALTTGLVPTPSRLSVAVNAGTVRVRPGEATAPGFFQKKSHDGWYDLSDVAITETAIDGKAPYGGLRGKFKLHIDRRTGDAEFGPFGGACEKTADQPNARKF
jgi:hypothetical protein